MRRAFHYAFVITLMAAGLALASTTRAGESKTAPVTTAQGPVIGRALVDHDEYLGIPYAAPPTGALRFRPPQAAAPWTTPRDATSPGARCPQIKTGFSSGATTEDCLFLNVYVPRRAAGPLPVMVWIHGGGFELGAASDYDASVLAVKGGVIVVTINYRLGALGFLAHDALSAEDPRRISGNYGLADQQAALRWVKRNIAPFGGNPENVTIFGQSAGGISVCAHLIAPESAGLFHRAISQSGFCSWSPPSLSSAAARGQAFAAAVGCDKGTDTATCLREKPVEALLAASPHLLSFTVNVDEALLPAEFRKAFAAGQFARVPLIMGGTHDEGSIFVALDYDLKGKSVTPAQYPAAIEARYGKQLVPSIMKRYPLSHYPTPSQAMAAIRSDDSACMIQDATRLLSTKTPVYAYEFNRRSPGGVEPIPPTPNLDYGVIHGAEINYLFAGKAQAYPNKHSLTQSEALLSDQLIGYWTRFAAGGDPNGKEAKVWPHYDGGSHAMRSFGQSIEIQRSAHKDHKCGFWSEIGDTDDRS